MLKQQFLTGHKRKSVCLIRTGVTGRACEHHFRHIGNLGLESWLNRSPWNLKMQIKWNFQNSAQGGLKTHSYIFFNKRSVYFCRTRLLAMVFLCSFGMCLLWSNLGDHAAHSKVPATCLHLCCAVPVLQGKWRRRLIQENQHCLEGSAQAVALVPNINPNAFGIAVNGTKLWELSLQPIPCVASPTLIQVRRVDSGRNIWNISIEISILIQSSDPLYPFSQREISKGE